MQVYRADLQQSLMKVAERNGVKVHKRSRICYVTISIVILIDRYLIILVDRIDLTSDNE